MRTIPTFDPVADLPRRPLAVEASAGTGKTYALSTLAARFVAEQDVAVGELLVVTFTRAAAAELKDRVRGRLQELAEALDSAEEPCDPVLAHLVPTDRDLRRHRVRTALADFDAATITTIHGFAQQVLGSIGSAVPADPDGMLTDDTTALTGQVAADVLAREAILCRYPEDEIPGLHSLIGAAGLALGNPAAVLVPDPDQVGERSEASLRRALVDEVVREVERRRRAAGTMSFEELLVGLRDALQDPAVGATARQALRRRFRVALIDEFQDTDPVQWAIFESLFDEAENADPAPGVLVLVGDPKQAIYGFRSADVHTYLAAAHAPGTDRVGLTTNWRSDGGLLRALEALFDGVTFGDDLIGYQPLDAAESHRDRRLTGSDGRNLPALSIRLVQGPNVERYQRSSDLVKADPARSAIYLDLAQHVRRLLETAVIPDERCPDGERALRPDDVAVLIGANFEGPAVRDALRRAGIPAVITRGDNVLESSAAEQWHLLLNAMARPADPRRARAFALSWFVGWGLVDLAEADEVEVGVLQEQLHRWAELLEGEGVAAFLGAVRAETGVVARVLARADGDRSMTDLEHIAELLHLASPRRTSAVMLLATFEAMAGGGEEGDPEADLAARRVESEAEAVQIMTTYVAKGLEFPVVCCTSLWATTPVGRKKIDAVHWDPDLGARVVDIAGDIPWPDEGAQEERQVSALVEAIGSNLRVLYVALTRARHHTALWWAPVQGAQATGLARVLFARDPGGAIDSEAFRSDKVDVPYGDDAIEALGFLAGCGADLVEVEEVDAIAGPPVAWVGRSNPQPAELRVATLGHEPDRARRRWSFTAMTSRAAGDHEEHLDPLDDSLGDSGADDEAADDSGVAQEESTANEPGELRVVESAGELPLGSIAGGTGFGNLVHEVLERVDFASDHLEEDLLVAVEGRLAWNPWPVPVDGLVRGLAAVIRTPLGPQFAGMRLADLQRADRLDELAFDLTLGERGTRTTDAQIGELLLDHLPDAAPLRPWAEHIAEGPFSAVLTGHLTGSIDLVARVCRDDGSQQFVVVDYKTNRLARAGSQPDPSVFHPDALVAEMARADYPLQALLYTVALHRYLRWRLEGYDPRLHLGGIAYLFVRGMSGPTTPTVDGAPIGLFSWDPSPELVTDLSDLLDGAARGRSS